MRLKLWLRKCGKTIRRKGFILYIRSKTCCSPANGGRVVATVVTGRELETEKCSFDSRIAEEWCCLAAARGWGSVCSITTNPFYDCSAFLINNNCFGTGLLVVLYA